MAAVREERVIVMATDGDAVTGKLTVQAIRADGAVADVQNTAGDDLIAFASEGGMSFPCGLHVNGLKRGAGSGTLFVYLE